jgi:hypothetical protein
MLQELSKKNPQLLRLIQENHDEFLQLINEPFDGADGYELFICLIQFWFHLICYRVIGFVNAK